MCWLLLIVTCLVLTVKTFTVNALHIIGKVMLQLMSNERNKSPTTFHSYIKRGNKQQSLTILIPITAMIRIK